MSQSLSYERVYPLIFAMATIIGAWLVDFALPENSTKELLAAVVSFGAILAGFIGTAKSILMALPQTLLAKLRNSTYMDDLSSYMASALEGSLLISAFSVVGFFDLPMDIKSYYPPIWAGLFMYAGMAFWRVSRIMVLLLRLDPEKL